MNEGEIDTYDTLADADYVFGELSDDGVQISQHWHLIYLS
jgi:hypothetical protein